MKTYNIILIYLTLLFILDVSCLMDLYGQNVIRRVVNMHRRTDEASYKKKLDPFCKKVFKFLNQEDIEKLKSIKIPNKKDLSIFSRKNTTSHVCCENFSNLEQDIIKNISTKIKSKYENETGKKLYFLKSNKPTIFVYRGKNSHHFWHVDPFNKKEIFNAIICIKKKGDISPLQCKDINNNITSIYFEEGDAAIFNGGTTVHQVPKNNDPNSERTVLSIAFTSDEELSNYEVKNLCTYIKGGNNHLNILKLVFSVFLINLLFSKFLNVKQIPYNTLLLYGVSVAVISSILPHLTKNYNIGSNRGNSIFKNLMLFLYFIIVTFSIKGGIIFASYFLLSDVLLPSKLVEYD